MSNFHSFAASIQDAIASCTFVSASSGVSPSDMQPGRSGDGCEVSPAIVLRQTLDAYGIFEFHRLPPYGLNIAHQLANVDRLDRPMRRYGQISREPRDVRMCGMRTLADNGNLARIQGTTTSTSRMRQSPAGLRRMLSSSVGRHQSSSPDVNNPNCAGSRTGSGKTEMPKAVAGDEAAARRALQ